LKIERVIRKQQLYPDAHKAEKVLLQSQNPTPKDNPAIERFNQT